MAIRGKASRSPEIGGLAEVKAWGWTPEFLAHRINEFRDRTIAGLDERCFVEPDFYGQLLFENSDNWKIIFDRPGNILGFWHNVPMTPIGHAMALKGNMCGERIVREIVPRMKSGQWYDTYFFSLSICPSIRRSMIVIRFSASIIQSLVDLAEKGVFVNNITMCYASSYSQLMNKFFLQFEYCGEHIVGGKMHRTHFPTFLKSRVMQISAGKNVKQLIQLYDESSPPVASTA